MSIMVYFVHKPDGTKLTLRKTKPLTLAEMQKLVEGYIEMYTIGLQTFVFNEEGKLKKLPTNTMYPWLVGTVIRGKLVDGKFVGFEEVLRGSEKVNI